ncbi:MAG: hypothetical protein P4L39_02875 [Humidesulfovibrio sp.]|nr:hypothetical protein [Humidesulfovibrio sp.]
MSIDTLVSLAILKVNWDKRGRDYIENFVPFVAEALRDSGDDVVSLPALQNDLRERFGLDLPLNPLRQVLQRAAKHNYVRRQSGVFYRNPVELSSLNFADVRNSVVSIHDRLLSRLREFVRTERRAEWSEEDAAAAVSEFLADHSLKLLYAQAEQTPLNTKGISREAVYSVASFLARARDSEPDILADFTTLAKGRLLASAIYLPDPGRVAQKFENTKIYIDTSILVFAAGYAGPERQAPCEELLRILRDHGARLYCFDFTLEEAKGILDACAARLRRGQLQDAYGPTIEWFIESGRSASDVELMIARFPEKLRSHGILVEGPPARIPEFNVDESGFEKALDNKIGYRNPKAREHDVDCVAAIALLRRGRHTRDIETSGAVFVTTNVELAKESRAFFQADAPEGSAALCVTDYSLGNLLWLKNPTQAPDLPLKFLLADAYAALQPPDELWKTYLTEIARLKEQGQITTDEYFTLRHSLSAKRALMDMTAGDTSTFAEGTIAEVLRVAAEHLRADLTEQVARERRKADDAEQVVSTLEQRDNARQERIRGRAAGIARVTSKVMCGGLLVVLAAGALLSFPWTLPQLAQAWYRYLTTGLLSAFFVFTLANMIWGTSVRSIHESLERSLERWILRRLLLIAGEILQP